MKSNDGRIIFETDKRPKESKMNFNEDKVIFGPEKYPSVAKEHNEYNIKNQTRSSLKFSVTVYFRSEKMQEILTAFESEDLEAMSKVGTIIISSRGGTLNLGRAQVITDREQDRRSLKHERFDNS